MEGSQKHWLGEVAVPVSVTYEWKGVRIQTEGVGYMRILVLSAVLGALLAASNANAFFGCLVRAAGPTANLNSGTCGGAQGLWDSYCATPYTGYSYGNGFCAYVNRVPPAPCGGGCSTGHCSAGPAWHGCGSGGAGCSTCSSGGCGCGARLGEAVQSLFSRLRCRCCSAGSTWVGGGPLDSYSPAAPMSFDSGIDMGYINSCSQGGCGGGCGCGG